MAVVFAICVSLLSVGFLWFWIVRPIAESYGLIVNHYDDAAADDMSSAESAAPASRRPSLETRNETDGQTEPAPRIKAEQLLTLYKVMRTAGIGRDEAAAAFKASGLPFNNNVWRDAEPPAKVAPVEEDELITPYAGRRTRASYYPEQPELEYQAP